MSVNEELEEKVLGELQDIFIELKDELWESLMERSGTPVDAMDYGIDALEQFKVLLKDQQLSLINKIEELESMQDEQGMGGVWIDGTWHEANQNNRVRNKLRKELKSELNKIKGELCQ